MQSKLEQKVFILFFVVVFFCPTDRPTVTRDEAMGNETFYWHGLMIDSLSMSKVSFHSIKRHIQN